MAARQLPQVVVPLRMDFSPASEAAIRELAAAEAALESAQARGLPDLVGHERRVKTARAALAGFYERLVVRALPPDDMDALSQAHPASAEQKAKAKEQGVGEPAWNPVTFCPALLAACVAPEEPGDEPLSEQDWADLVSKGPVSNGEVRYLINTALDINDRSPDPDLGKG